MTLNRSSGSHLKPIETQYKGYRFRSRLEARWAVFFDTLGIHYEYEKEGYDLDGTWYLPDFYLPEHDFFYEIKGVAPDDNEIIKATKLALNASPVIITWSYFDAQSAYKTLCCYRDRKTEVFNTVLGAAWAKCYICGWPNLLGAHWLGPGKILGMPYKDKQFRPFDANLICPCNKRKRPKMDFKHPDIIAAYTAARSARFEHGESP